jgi:hypothetical protein
VGAHYALVAQRQGLALDPDKLTNAFAIIWREMPPRPATGEPREDDDKGWWRELVERLTRRVFRAGIGPLRSRHIFSKPLTESLRRPESGSYIPEVREVNETLAPRYQLAVISNFDGRLRSSSSAFRSRNISGTFLFPANWGRTSPIP